MTDNELYVRTYESRSNRKFFDCYYGDPPYVTMIISGKPIDLVKRGQFSGSLVTPYRDYAGPDSAFSQQLLNQDHITMNTNTTQFATNSLLARHDTVSDIFVAPLGRVAGLRSMLSGVSATVEAYKLDKDHDRKELLKEVAAGFDTYFASKYPGLKSFHVCMDIQCVEELGIDGSYNWQISVCDVSAQKELVAFVRFVDGGKSSPSTIRFVSFAQGSIDFAKALTEKYAPVKEYTITNLDVIGTDLQKTEQRVLPKDAKLFESFYPFIEGGAENLIEEFYESRANVLILTGIQGSGKSSLFRCMLNSNTEGEFYVVDNPGIYKNPDQLGLILSFLRERALKSQVTVALEEIDAFVKEKDIDNMFLPRLLSISSGIVASNIKFVLMANVPTVGQYAESLTRDGRTFAAVNFSELTPEQAAVARADYGLEPLAFDENHALATVLNARQRKPKKARTSIGFVS